MPARRHALRSLPRTPPGEAGTCRDCGCTDDDCTACFMRTGRACWWVQPDLCSACVRGSLRLDPALICEVA